MKTPNRSPNTQPLKLGFKTPLKLGPKGGNFIFQLHPFLGANSQFQEGYPAKNLKTNMTMENPPFEYEFPIEHEGFSSQFC